MDMIIRAELLNREKKNIFQLKLVQLFQLELRQAGPTFLGIPSLTYMVAFHLCHFEFEVQFQPYLHSQNHLQVPVIDKININFS